MMRTLISLTFFVVVMTAGMASAAPQKKAAENKPVTAKALPEDKVMLDGEPLFAVRAKVLSFSPEERAKAISSRLARIVKDSLFHINELKVVDSESTSDIVSGEFILMTVTEADAAAEGKSRQALAQEFAEKIRTAVDASNREYSIRSLLFSALYTVLATVALIAAILVMNIFHPRIISRIESWRGTFIRSIRFQSVEVLNEERITRMLFSLVRGTRLVLFLALFYLYLPLVLSFFPWTRGMATKLLDYIITPIEKAGMAFVNYLPNVFFLLVIAAITRYAIKFIGFLFAEVGNKNITIPGFFHEWASPTFKIVRFLTIAFSVVVAFPYLPGADSPAFKGVSVFLGVLFSLGSSSAIANIVAGVILTYMRAFKLGDRVKITDTIGDVVEMNLLITRIRTIKNVEITVPNAMVLGSHITNFSSSAQDYGLILHTTVTIGYDAPWRQVHELLVAAAKATENILELPEPFVLQTSLDDFYVSYQINAYTEKPSIMARTYSQLHQNIQEKFNEAGVEIMSPHYATLRDGNMTTIPESYLPGTYKQPPFRVSNVDATG